MVRQWCCGSRQKRLTDWQILFFHGFNTQMSELFDSPSSNRQTARDKAGAVLSCNDIFKSLFSICHNESNLNGATCASRVCCRDSGTQVAKQETNAKGCAAHNTADSASSWKRRSLMAQHLCWGATTPSVASWTQVDPSPLPDGQQNSFRPTLQS